MRALVFVGDGIRDVSWISDMLRPDIHEEGIEPAPAYGLLLVNVFYDPNPEWIEDGYSIKRANETVTCAINKYKVMATVMEQMLKETSGDS